ncbi:hypothetical protein AYO20_08210 [Fonsecaea nubica]|uniref:Uncharacterized protein n=1 Tax=Fonsecaea nubica TaxID=856822 RepID=A0A178CN98_9EURO|nr:hypothetical protein AYO20_08210 [Fonsecaea nubica]OAL31300.1 hypothetical protein AYO20_08210 [Fonsecaea nubica]
MSLSFGMHVGETFGEDRLYVDLGRKSVSLVHRIPVTPSTYLWRRCCLESSIDWLYEEECRRPSHNGPGTYFYTQSMLRDAASVTSVPPKRPRLYRGGVRYIQNYNPVKEVVDIGKRMPFENDDMEELAVGPLLSQTARAVGGGRPRERRILRRVYTQSPYRTRISLHDNRHKDYSIRQEAPPSHPTSPAPRSLALGIFPSLCLYFATTYLAAQIQRWQRLILLAKSGGTRPLPEFLPILPSQKHLLAIRASALKAGEDDDILKIIDASYVASYNWLARDKPTILVPGSPPRWAPPVHAPALKQDRGTYFRDKNASQYAPYPTEPGVRAIFTMKPDFDGQEVDVFACGNTMGSLLAFVGERDRTFRFVAEKVGSTLFLIRKENNPRDTIPDVRGNGHTFPEAYTNRNPACIGSQSHQRLVSYSFGGLNLVVRFEIDGYLPRKLEDDYQAKRLEVTPPLGTVPNFIVAYHDRGIFMDVQNKDVRAGVEDWEDNNKETLERLKEVLTLLDVLAQKQVNWRIEIRRVAKGNLAV